MPENQTHPYRVPVATPVGTPEAGRYQRANNVSHEGFNLLLEVINSDASSWIGRAACRGVAEVFFPTFDFKDNEKIEEPAKRICVICPVKEDCLNYALERREPDGVWGGLNAKERRRITRRSRAKTGQTL